MLHVNYLLVVFYDTFIKMSLGKCKICGDLISRSVKEGWTPKSMERCR